MLQCSQPSQMPAGLRPRWISAATRLVGPLPEVEPALARRTDFSAVTFPFPLNATRRGRRSFVAHHENRNALSRLYRRAETLPRRFYHGLADQPGRTWPRRCGRGKSERGADRTGRGALQSAGQDRRFRQEARGPGKIQTRRASLRRLSAAETAGARQRAAVYSG